jgi:hypothetical protein
MVPPDKSLSRQGVFFTTEGAEDHRGIIAKNGTAAWTDTGYGEPGSYHVFRM